MPVSGFSAWRTIRTTALRSPVASLAAGALLAGVWARPVVTARAVTAQDSKKCLFVIIQPPFLAKRRRLGNRIQPNDLFEPEL